MTIRMKLMTAALVLSAIGGAYIGVRAGCYYQAQIDQRQAVANESGHYDQRTGKFVWGAVPDAKLSALAAAIDDKALSPAEDVKPKHKPTR